MKGFDCDVIIVGGGHNGLVAASYLARAGKTVRILEANSELGEQLPVFVPLTALMPASLVTHTLSHYYQMQSSRI